MPIEYGRYKKPEPEPDPLPSSTITVEFAGYVDPSQTMLLIERAMPRMLTTAAQRGADRHGHAMYAQDLDPNRPNGEHLHIRISVTRGNPNAPKPYHLLRDKKNGNQET